MESGVIYRERPVTHREQFMAERFDRGELGKIVMAQMASLLLFALGLWHMSRLDQFVPPSMFY